MMLRGMACSDVAWRPSDSSTTPTIFNVDLHLCPKSLLLCTWTFVSFQLSRLHQHKQAATEVSAPFQCHAVNAASLAKLINAHMEAELGHKGPPVKMAPLASSSVYRESPGHPASRCCWMPPTPRRLPDQSESGAAQVAVLLNRLHPPPLQFPCSTMA